MRNRVRKYSTDVLTIIYSVCIFISRGNDFSHQYLTPAHNGAATSATYLIASGSSGGGHEK